VSLFAPQRGAINPRGEEILDAGTGLLSSLLLCCAVLLLLDELEEESADDQQMKKNIPPQNLMRLLQDPLFKRQLVVC
jgi:hypothetical protein